MVYPGMTRPAELAGGGLFLVALSGKPWVSEAADTGGAGERLTPLRVQLAASLAPGSRPYPCGKCGVIVALAFHDGRKAKPVLEGLNFIVGRRKPIERQRYINRVLGLVLEVDLELLALP